MFNHTGGLLLQTVFFMINKDSETSLTMNTIEQVRRGEDMKALCYDELGCYSINPPWTDESRPVSQFPQSPDYIRPQFCLFTRHNPNHCQELKYNDSQTIYKSFLVPTHKIYFIAHGFLENGEKPWMRQMTQKLLMRSDCNVITVDWQGGSKPPYTQAVANIRLVGVMTAHLINTLHRDVGVKTEYCHVIGHSLGAHLSGYVGNTLKTKFNLTLGRITGMDPAEPHFSKTDPVVRLDPTDAIYVDIIHTDATPFIQGGLGMDEPIGHLDFYPNGGATQPGCEHGIMKNVDMLDGSLVKGVKRFLNCDHVRSYEYFIESVMTPCQFLSVECDTWENFAAGNCFKCRDELNPTGRICAKMGKNSMKEVQRSAAEVGLIYPRAHRTLVKLFTITGETYPFCRSLYRVTLVISNSLESQEHKGEIGQFSVEINGIDGHTEIIPLFKEQYYRPGSVHRQVVGGIQVGRIRSARLHWVHVTTFNMLTWRIALPRIHVQNLIIDNLEHDASFTLCKTKDEIVLSGKPVDMRPCAPVKRIEE